MAVTTGDLRLLICEDEYLLATDMAQQFSDLGATMVGVFASAGELARDTGNANAAVLDTEVLDGEIYSIVPMLEERGIAVVFCSGFAIGDRPARFSHLAWFDKLAPVEEIASALCRALEAQETATRDLT